jgi:hypothetical protein
MQIPSRRTFWLSAATLLVAIVVGAWFLVPPSRINRENFERIQAGMSESQVTAILGQPRLVRINGVPILVPNGDHGYKPYPARMWGDGPSWIFVAFGGDNKVYGKDVHFATSWETLKWHAKKCAAKIGVT